MAESSTKETRQSRQYADDQVQYTGELLLVDTSRPAHKEPPNARIYLKKYEQYVAVNIGETSEENRLARERVDQYTEEARNRNVLGSYGIRFEDLGIPPRYSHTKVTPEQPLPSDDKPDTCLSTSDILARLIDVATSIPERQKLVCEAELIRFTGKDREALLQVLWPYILDHRDSNDRNELVAVGAAIRKYIAIMPIEQMGELAELLEPGHRAPLPVELELEVAKMVYRNFEVFPPQQLDPHPALAARLWEMAQDYIKPRFLLRRKHSAVASLAIEALIAMRSAYAGDALRIALDCPYSWFSDIVKHDLRELHNRWAGKDDDAVAWLESLCAAAADI